MATEFSFSDARSHLTDIANKVAFGGSRAIITRNGQKIMAIVSIEDLEALQAMEDQLDLRDAKKSLADAKKNGTVSWESVKKKLDL